MGASFLRGAKENPMGPLIKNFKTIVLECPGKGAFFFAELC
jgi:hypothetical protein